MNRIVPIAQPKQIMPQRSNDFIDMLMEEYVTGEVFSPARPCYLVTGQRHQCSLLDHLDDLLNYEDDPRHLFL